MATSSTEREFGGGVVLAMTLGEAGSSSTAVGASQGLNIAAMIGIPAGLATGVSRIARIAHKGSFSAGGRERPAAVVLSNQDGI